MDSENQVEMKVRELQGLDYNLQGLISQRQMLDVEMREIENAQTEVNATEKEIFKVVSGVMVEADKEKVLSDLAEKKKLLDMQIDALNKQENLLSEQAKKLREEIQGSFQQKKGE